METFHFVEIHSKRIHYRCTMDGPINNSSSVDGNARRGTATEFSYMLQREVIATKFKGGYHDMTLIKLYHM